MSEKMQESGFTEIIPFICISAIWGQYPVIFHFLNTSGLLIGSGCGLTADRSQVLFSFLGALRAQKFTFGGQESLMAVACLFTDMVGTLHFSNVY